MSIRNWLYNEVADLRGAWTTVAQIRKGRPDRAFLSRNMRFSPGNVYSREGYSARLAVAGKVTSMFNWLNQFAATVLYFESGTTIKIVNIATNAITTLFTGLTGRGISMAEANTRAYITTYDVNGVGTGGPLVTTGGTDSDKAFQPPLVTTSFTATDNGAGLCTAGTHKFGLVFQSRSGFTGKPGPTPLDTFTPISFTCQPNRVIRLSITLNTPAAAGLGSAIYPIMTRSDNPNKWFFVPGVFVIPPPSTAGWSISMDISVTDEDLANRASSADNNFNLLSQTIGGTAPFAASQVFIYNRRNVYLAGSIAYISDPDGQQQLNPAFNALYMPGQKQMFTGGSLGSGSLYIFGENWTAATEDNGNYPITWQQPRLISDRIGTRAPAGVCWKTRGGYGWVASEDGLYIFDGSYSDRPISYLQTDVWKRINWTAAYAVQVVDDFVNLRCYVAAPLDSATEPSHLLVYDYTNGRTFDSCDFSLDDFDSHVLFSAIALVKEANTSRSVMWMAPQAAGQILKQDPTVHSDNGYAISGRDQYETGWMRQDMSGGQLIRVGNCHYYAKGSGQLLHTFYSKDHGLSVTPPALTLSTAPGKELFDKFDLAPVENFSISFQGSGGVNDWYEIEMLRPYYRGYLANR